MSSTLLEQTRATHEEIERLQRGLIEEMKRAPKTHKDNVIQSHKVNKTLDRITDASKRLERVYEDKDGSRKEEIASVGGTGPSLYSLFYERLREIKDYHRRYPNVQGERPEDLFVDESEIAFTGEEGFGKYLDLHDLYTQYNNLDKVKRIDYLAYVYTFYRFEHLSESRLYSRKHKEYVTALLDYLVSFLKRTQPLLVLETELAPHEKEFEEKWKSGAFGPTSANKNNATTTTPSAAQDTTATANSDNNNKKKKNRKRKTKNPIDPVQQRKEIMLKELRVEKIGELLSEQVSNTKAYIEKKQSLSAEERLKELELEEQGEEEEEEEEDEEEPVRMTIENYPIGWDGKPIPYWLYKLHGLGIEYKCEICGNTSYFGRKAFEKHFQEWRHAHGMTCLGIPNTLHFQEITKIQDAQALWAKIKVDGQKISWKPEAEEEYEDVEGHVMSRKTFEDLKRQGLV
jgi:splicing factor 3A subunit 3